MNRKPIALHLLIFVLLPFTAGVTFAGVHADAPSEVAQFDFLDGQFVCDGQQLTGEGTYIPFTGVWTGGYVLDGFAFADEFRVLAADGNPVFFGRNFRAFDAETGRWKIQWHEVVSGAWHELEGSKEGETIVLTTHARDQTGEYASRITFSDFTSDRFAWRDDRSYDGGKSWIEDFTQLDCHKEEVTSMVSVAARGLSDLRNEKVKAAVEDASAHRRGRELLERAARAHGLEAWERFTTQEVLAVDEWSQAEHSWWPDGDQRFKHQSILGTFTSRMELRGGSRDGEVLGLQAWSPYHRKDPKASAKSNEERVVSFYLPTLQYFNELPFRLLSAEHVVHAGEATHRGRAYDLVFATWGSFDPNPKFDQYMVWIDRETLLIGLCHYTVRESGIPAAAGTIFFEDYRDVQGVQVAFVHTVTIGGPDSAQYPLEENYFHRLMTESVTFDSVPRTVLLPLPGGTGAADRKPLASR